MEKECSVLIRCSAVRTRDIGGLVDRTVPAPAPNPCPIHLCTWGPDETLGLP